MPSPSQKTVTALISFSDAAKTLRVPEQTLARWLRQGVLTAPVHYRQQERYLEKHAFTRWAHSHRMDEITRPAHALPFENTHAISLKTALIRGGVYYSVKGGNVEQVYANLVNALPIEGENETTEITQREALLNGLVHRERLRSTAIGKQVALPHPATPQNWGFGGYAASIAFLNREVPWKASDGQPIQLLLALFPTTIQEHMQLISDAHKLATNPPFLDLIHSPPKFDTLLAMVGS